eukprot:7628931-Alexandrium_andersonii.AAC.1
MSPLNSVASPPPWTEPKVGLDGLPRGVRKEHPPRLSVGTQASMAVSTTRVVREVTAMLTLELRLTLMLSTTDAARVLTEVWVEVTEASATTLASHRRSSTESRPP